MAATNFSKKEAIRFAWEKMKENLGFFVLLLAAVFCAYLIFALLERMALKSDRVLFLPIRITTALLKMMISIGFLRISLKYCDGGKGAFTDFCSETTVFLRYVAGTLLYILIFIGGLLLLIVPGLIWGVRFQFYGYLIVDQKLGPIEALKRSAAITKGSLWQLFSLWNLIALINFLGVLCLLVGLFATLPVSMIAMAYVYRKLEGQTSPVSKSATTPASPGVFAKA